MKEKYLYSETKSEKCEKYCVGCEMYTNEFCEDNSSCDNLCKDCDDDYNNITGYCSLDCCLTGVCDGAC